MPPKQTSTRIFSVENGILQIHMLPDWQQSFQLLLQLLKFSLNSRYILEMAFEPMGGITITKVPARHGDNLETVAYLGESSGYVLQGEDKTLYLAGDTVYFDGVAQTIDTYHPDVIVLNCCEATMPMGRLIMNLNDVEIICKKAPNATIIATHLDSVNHALLSSDDVRAFTARKKLTQLHVPANGEWIILP